MSSSLYNHGHRWKTTAPQQRYSCVGARFLTLAWRRLLETMGCTASFVTDSKRAIETASAMSPQVVFIDIGMPDINGFELARREAAGVIIRFPLGRIPASR